MGLFSKLKKIGKKVAGATLGKALKHDPLGKALLKHDPLGKRLVSHATMGGTDAALGMGGKKKGIAGKLGQAMLARRAGGNTGIMPPHLGGGMGPMPDMAQPMMRPAIIPHMPPEMGGGLDPMYANIDQNTGLSIGGPPPGAPQIMTGGPMQADQMGGPPAPMGGPPAPDMMGPPPQTGPMMGPPRPNPMRGGMLRRRLALNGGGFGAPGAPVP